MPFDIKRVFYINDVPDRMERGGHALKACHQLLISIAGSFQVTLKNGKEVERVQLSSPESALYIPPNVWREMDNFSQGAGCLVLASREYDESDYYRNFSSYVDSIVSQ